MVSPARIAEVVNGVKTVYGTTQAGAAKLKWLRDRPMATPKQFMAKLREIYNRKDMLKRFPNGFGSAT
jgi:hypothetical protein